MNISGGLVGGRRGSSARFPSDLFQVSQFPSWGRLKSGTCDSGSLGLGYHRPAFYLDSLNPVVVSPPSASPATEGLGSTSGHH